MSLRDEVDILLTAQEIVVDLQGRIAGEMKMGSFKKRSRGFDVLQRVFQHLRDRSDALVSRHVKSTPCA